MVLVVIRAKVNLEVFKRNLLEECIELTQKEEAQYSGIVYLELLNDGKNYHVVGSDKNGKSNEAFPFKVLSADEVLLIDYHEEGGK